MQCGELVYRKVTIMTQGSDSVDSMYKKPEKETIHSGHFMVSHFEAEAQDDEYDVAVPIPGEDSKSVASPSSDETTQTFVSLNHFEKTTQQVSIETSLTKLFQCMSLAYRQKLTSPKWNRFKGIRLRWKDKIRLNNVIWRCWHMQFIMKQNTMVCQFASPLDVDTHNKPEAVVLEGKYWKRKLAAVTAEYKKWRMFYRNRIIGWACKDSPDMLSTDMDMFDWQPHSNDSNSVGSMMVDEDYMEFMSDTLFSTIQSNQPFAFPDSREIARGAGLADFIQPSLVQLQPNLDDFMDTLEPLQDLVSLANNIKLPSVPEECVADDIFRPLSSRTSSLANTFPEISLLDSQTNALQAQLSQHQQEQQKQQQQQNLQYSGSIFAQTEVNSSFQSSTDLVVKSENYAQGPVNITFEGTPAPSAPANRRNSRMQQRTSETRLLQRQQQQQQRQQQRQQQQQQQSAAVVTSAVTSALFQSPQAASQAILLTQPAQQTQQQQSRRRQQVQGSSFQSISPARLSPPSVGQPQAQSQGQTQSQFPGQQPSFHATVSQVQGFKTFPMSSPPSLASVADLPLSGVSISPPLKQSMLRSNSLTGAEEEPFAMPKQYPLTKRNRSRSGSSLVPGVGLKQFPAPLVSTNSDPSLPTVPGGSNIQPLLAQLLSTSSTTPGVFNFTGSDRFKNQQMVPILPMPAQGLGSTVNAGSTQTGIPQTTTAVLITTPVSVATVTSLNPPAQTSNGSQLLLNSLASNVKVAPYAPDSSTPVSVNMCPMPSSITLSNMSPPRPLRVRPDSATQRSRHPDSTMPKEHRRECHTKAEHKRRCNIKNGFDMLHSLIPQLNQNPNAKLSKAAMLQKGADYIQQLRAERDQLREEMLSLKQEIECLNASISNCQSLLPATGAPVSRQRTSKMREMFDEYVRMRTLENWKFWIFSILVEPLLTSFNTSVSTASLDDLYRSTLHWVEQHCSLVDLRPAVLNSLRYLSTATEILTDPSKLPEEARRAVLKQDAPH